MLVADLLHSCANDRVAEAAVASIGGDFSLRIKAEASRRGVSVGNLASTIVRNFAVVATERDWRVLTDATRGHDFPVLAGLEVILSRPTFRPRSDAQRDEERGAAPASIAAAAAASMAMAGGY